METSGKMGIRMECRFQTEWNREESKRGGHHLFHCTSSGIHILCTFNNQAIPLFDASWCLTTESANQRTSDFWFIPVFVIPIQSLSEFKKSIGCTAEYESPKSITPCIWACIILTIRSIHCEVTYTVDLLNPQIFGKNDLYIDYCLFLNPFYVFLFVIIFVESHLTSDCFWHPLQTYLKTPPMAGLKASILTSFGWLLETAVSTWKPLLICHDNPWL